MDHLLAKNQFEKLYELNLNKNIHYVPGRQKADGSWYKRHPNSYIIHKDLYWKAGGYDESFSGHYGTDSTFRRQLARVSQRIELGEQFYLTLYGREVIEDASTRNYGRKGSEYSIGNNPELKDRVFTQLSGYVKRIRKNFPQYKECYEKNALQKQKLGLLSSNLKIAITKGVLGFVVVGGYSGLAEQSIKKLKSEHPNIKVLAIKNKINLDKAK